MSGEGAVKGVRWENSRLCWEVHWSEKGKTEKGKTKVERFYPQNYTIPKEIDNAKQAQVIRAHLAAVAKKRSISKKRSFSREVESFF